MLSGLVDGIRTALADRAELSRIARENDPIGTVADAGSDGGYVYFELDLNGETVTVEYEDETTELMAESRFQSDPGEIYESMIGDDVYAYDGDMTIDWSMPGRVYYNDD